MFDLLLALKPADPAPVDYPFNDSEVAAWDAVTATQAGERIDDSTWSDMLVPAWLARLGKETSIFGQQWLYRQLRRGAAVRPQPTYACRESDQAALRCLRHAEVEIGSTLFGDTLKPAPQWLRYAPLLLAIVPLSIVACAFHIGWLAGVIAGCFLLILAQAACHADITDWYGRLRTMQMMLRAVTLLGDDGRAARLNRQLEKPAAERVPLLNTYSEWLLLSNVRHYVKTRAIVLRERGYLQACFERCAQADGELALARHLQSAGPVCPAGEGGQLLLQSFRHPLLDDAQALDLDVRGEGVFLSGQNGVGKSTLLRAVGLNILSARAFGFCYAASATVPPLAVHSSMRNEDSLADGESQYQAELRRARELLEAPAAIYIIDEIFRGTNHLESVSAAAAVLRELARKGVVLVSSHNVVLASLLAPGIEPMHLFRDGERLVLAPGVLRDTNGIAMLAQRGLPDAVTAEAETIYRQLAAAMAEPEVLR